MSKEMSDPISLAKIALIKAMAERHGAIKAVGDDPELKSMLDWFKDDVKQKKAALEKLLKEQNAKAKGKAKSKKGE